MTRKMHNVRLREGGTHGAARGLGASEDDRPLEQAAMAATSAARWAGGEALAASGSSTASRWSAGARSALMGVAKRQRRRSVVDGELIKEIAPLGRGGWVFGPGGMQGQQGEQTCRNQRHCGRGRRPDRRGSRWCRAAASGPMMGTQSRWVTSSIAASQARRACGVRSLNQ